MLIQNLGFLHNKGHYFNLYCVPDETLQSGEVVAAQYIVTKKLSNIGDSAPFCPLLLFIVGQNSLDTGQMWVKWEDQSFLINVSGMCHNFLQSSTRGCI